VLSALLSFEYNSNPGFLKYPGLVVKKPGFRLEENSQKNGFRVREKLVLMDGCFQVGSGLLWFHA